MKELQCVRDLGAAFEHTLRRWRGRYLVSHNNNEPDRIWFFGYSGD
jgi:hypothetical protein